MDVIGEAVSSVDIVYPRTFREMQRIIGVKMTPSGHRRRRCVYFVYSRRRLNAVDRDQ